MIQVELVHATMVQNLRQMTHSMFLPFPFIIEHPKELKSCLQNSLDIVTYLQATLALTSCNFTLYEAQTGHNCKSKNSSHSLKKVEIISPMSCSFHPSYTTLDPPKQAFCSLMCYSISSVILFSFSLSIWLSIFLSKSGYCTDRFQSRLSDSIRGCVRRSVGRSVSRSVGHHLFSKAGKWLYCPCPTAATYAGQCIRPC